jgi:hypothetical protein
MSLTDAITAARATNQRALEKSLDLERPQLSDADRLHIERFRLFARSKGVSGDAAVAPATVAAYLQAQSDQDLEPAMAAITAWHSYYFLADPCSSIPVRTVLERRLRIEFPRSWSREDRLLFASLGPDQKAVLFKREEQRDAALRRKQNELAGHTKGVAAELRKFINRSKDQRKD